MKKTILLLAILAVVASFARGQQVSNSAFTAAIGPFNVAMSLKNVANETSSLGRLNNMMGSQIGYMNSNVGALQARYVTDTTKAAQDYAAANKELLMARAADSSGGASGLAQQDIIKAEKDINNALTILTSARQQGNVVKQQAALLATEQSNYLQIQKLSNGINSNSAAILGDLKAFAATLQ